MKYFCTQCGRRVPQRLDLATRQFSPGVCADHPAAKRMSETYCRRQFSKAKAAALGEDYKQRATARDLERRAA